MDEHLNAASLETLLIHADRDLNTTSAVAGADLSNRELCQELAGLEGSADLISDFEQALSNLREVVSSAGRLQVAVRQTT